MSVYKKIHKLLLLCCIGHTVSAQSKTGLENYNSYSPKTGFVWIPVLHHQGKKGLYTELRYNYEASKTASLYSGKTFSGKGILRYTVTPMLGIVLGKFTGASMALNVDLEYKKISLSAQTQYTMNKNGVADNYIFNWSELVYQPSKWIYTGVSAQETRSYRTRFISERGIVAGFLINKLTIPIYIFNPFSPDKNFIVGVNIDW